MLLLMYGFWLSKKLYQLPNLHELNNQDIHILVKILSFLFLCSLTLSAVDKPNIIFILTDDQGYGDLSSMGAEGFSTPNIDRLAHEGMKFNDFYVHNRCSPTRLAFMTGSDANRAGYNKVIYKHSHVGINSEEITTPELLKKAGYTTGIVGK